MSFYEKTGTAASGSSHRRTWDTTEYQIKANERTTKEREEADRKKGKGKGKRPKVPDELKPPPPKKLLQARDDKVDLEGKINKQVVINKTSNTSDTGGFYCDVCDCILKDSINYLDHINGKNHQRNMGHSMKVKRSTIDDVREKLAKKKFEQTMDKIKTNDEDVEADIKEEEAKMADLKRQKKSQKKKAPLKEEEEIDDHSNELYSIMGLAGFGGSKKNN